MYASCPYCGRQFVISRWEEESAKPGSLFLGQTRVVIQVPCILCLGKGLGKTGVKASIIGEKQIPLDIVLDERKRFIIVYLYRLRIVYQRLKLSFQISAAIFILVSSIPIIVNSLNNSVSILSLIILSSVGYLFWIVASFFSIQMSKVEQDLAYEQKVGKETSNMSKELLNRAKERVPGIINTVKIFRGPRNGNINISQGGSISLPGARDELIEQTQGIALLLAYCQESNNSEAQLLSRSIADEIEKPEPNKTLIFNAWSKIISLIPTISQVASIANVVRTFLT